MSHYYSPPWSPAQSPGLLGGSDTTILTGGGLPIFYTNVIASGEINITYHPSSSTVTTVSTSPFSVVSTSPSSSGTVSTRVAAPTPATSASSIELHKPEYQAIEESLSLLRSAAEDEDWRIEQSVYTTSVQVAAALMASNIPAPHVFSHGPGSVVFNWSRLDLNLYLTISTTHLSALVSTEAGIKYRSEIASGRVDRADKFISALGSSWPTVNLLDTKAPTSA